MKRNDVVYEKEYVGFCSPVFGRINRVIDDEMVEVIYIDMEIRIEHVDDLEVMENYRGYWRDGYWYKDGVERFIPMPTLRKLKQAIASFDKTVWKKNRSKMNKNCLPVGIYPVGIYT